MRPAFGSLVGAVGGLLFVLISAPDAAGDFAWLVRTTGVVAFVAVVAFVLTGNRSAQPGSTPSQQALRIYGWSVLAMVVAIPLGSAVLQRSGFSAVVLPWVVLVVGAHFLPMARAFEAPLLLRLGVTLVALGLLGGLLALLLGPGVSPWVGVITGLVLLAFSASGAADGRRAAAAQPGVEG